MKCLVTGHRGSIGRRLNERLIRDGHTVFGVDLKDGVDCADISNLNSFCGVEVIFHLAAHLSPPKKNTMDSCDGILSFAKREKSKIVYASSAAVYNPQTMYGVHKLYGEGLFMTELKNTAALRLFNVYGGNGIGLIDKIQKKEHIRVNGSGMQRRDYVHVNDVVDAFIAAINWEGTVDIGTGISYSVNQVLEMFEYTDYEHVKGYGGVPDSVAKLNVEFPWKPTYILPQYAEAQVVTTS